MNKKMIKYREAGVREYWIIHPQKEVVIVYRFDQPDERSAAMYSFEEEIESLVIEGLKICLADLLLEV